MTKRHKTAKIATASVVLKPSSVATQMLHGQDFHSLVAAVARARKRILDGTFNENQFLSETGIGLRKIQEALDEQAALAAFREKAAQGACDADVREGILEVDSEARVSRTEYGAYVSAWIWVLPSCKKCGSNVGTDGLCSDETCPYSDWPQIVDLEDLYRMSAEEIEKKYSVRKGAA